MRNSALMIGLVLLVLPTTGMSECDPGGGSANGDGPAACAGRCKVEIHLNEKCEPVDVDGTSMNSAKVNPNAWVCFVNDAGCTIRLTFPDNLFSKGETEVTLEDGECARLRIDKQAARKTIMYTIACDCPGVPGGGSGNPEFNVGGGGSGGGGSGGGG